MTTSNNNKMRNGGALLMESLIGLGARQAFGVPGESYLAVLDAMHDHQDEFDFLICRQEGGAAFMAEAWGKLTGEPGICFVTRGPGATNASIGVHAARQASTPMLLFVGQAETTTRDREAFQEVDYRAVFGTLAKWATEIEHTDRIPEIVSRAWAMALSGRPGPVVIALPENVLAGMSDVEPCRAARIGEAAPDERTLAEIASLLKGAERPVILAGGGGWNEEGRAALRRFAEANALPVSLAFRYLDLMDHASPSYCGDAGIGMAPAVRKMLLESDLILAINVRFGEMTTDAWTLFEPPETGRTLVHAHASEAEINKIYRADLPVVAGPNRLCEALAAMGSIGEWQEWRDDNRSAVTAGWKARSQPGPVDMAEVTAWLEERLGSDSIVTNGAGNFAIWPNRFLRFGNGRRLLAPQSGAMGYGIPAAIAARKAHPDKLVVCFAGDGDFQMTCQELGSAMQAGCQPVILVLNNGSYGTIRMHQERNHPGRVSGTRIVNPDFVALARSYGMLGERVSETADFPGVFERAVASPTGAVIELDISIEALTPSMTLSEIRDAALKRE